MNSVFLCLFFLWCSSKREYFSANYACFSKKCKISELHSHVIGWKEILTSNACNYYSLWGISDRMSHRTQIYTTSWHLFSNVKTLLGWWWREREIMLLYKGGNGCVSKCAYRGLLCFGNHACLLHSGCHNAMISRAHMLQTDYGNRKHDYAMFSIF